MSTSDPRIDLRTADPAAVDPPPIAAFRRMIASIGLSQFGISIVYGAVPNVLLALQVQQLAGDANKAAVLSAFTLGGAVAALIAQPLAGRLSDVTRTRIGSRTPFVLGGSLLAAPLLLAMGWAESLVVLAVLYIGSEFVLSAAQGPLAAVLPDRVPVRQRGRFSAGLGLGMMLGSVIGTILGSLLSDDLTLAYLVVAVIPVLLASTRLFVVPDPDNRRVPRPLAGSNPWRRFFVSPRSHPDFWWVVGSRMLIYTGFFVVQGYYLYLLDDYVGLGTAAVDFLPIVMLITAAGVCTSAVLAGIFSDRLGRRRIFVLWAAVAMSCGLLIPLFAPTLEGFMVMAAITGLAFGTFEAVDTALVTQVLPRSTSFAQDLGVVNVASIAPQILAPAIAGAIVVATAGYALVFPIGAALALIGGIAVMRVRTAR